MWQGVVNCWVLGGSVAREQEWGTGRKFKVGKYMGRGGSSGRGKEVRKANERNVRK